MRYYKETISPTSCQPFVRGYQRNFSKIHMVDLLQRDAIYNAKMNKERAIKLLRRGFSVMQVFKETGIGVQTLYKYKRNL